MSNLIIIGTITKPQGIKGEVKIIPYTDNAMRFNNLKSVYIDDVSHEIESVRVNGSDVYIKFSKISDRNAAEKMRGKDLSILREEAAKPPKGRHLIIDLIGCKVYSSDNYIGVLVNIIQSGAADVYEVQTLNGKLLMFPALKDLILNIDIDDKTITIDPVRLEEVAVYED